ncbi:MAG: zinc dependent phospholipase C family protein [Lachnospiraceae bacterium]|nr:zinc dependent phospholipase C family protein [Lachnospiraceae bacterium]
MRKKSHIALASCLLTWLGNEELDRYWKAFYFGSIQPDLNPKMFAEPHEFDASWDKIRDRIRQIEAEANEEETSRRVVWTHIGIVLHYLADYFTFPHNTCYPGSLKDHCLYENRMKYLMRAYLCTEEAQTVFEEQRGCSSGIRTAEQLFACIEQMHRSYMHQAGHSELDDCRSIMQICACACLVLARMACVEEPQVVWHGSCVA